MHHSRIPAIHNLLSHLHGICVLMLLLTAPSAARADLREAYQRQDTAALARHGVSMGARGLSKAMAQNDRLAVCAAITASVHASDSWALLGALARRGADPDRSMAIRAAQSAVAIASTLDSGRVEDDEISQEFLQKALGLWSQIALDPGRDSDLRILAVEIASLLRQQTKAASSPSLAALFRDADPQIGYAALVLTAFDSRLDEEALQSLDDADPGIALGAAQRFCGPLGRATPVQVSLTLDQKKKLYVLAKNNRLQIVHRADLVPCLVRDAKGRSVAGTLATKAPKHLRKAIMKALSR